MDKYAVLVPTDRKFKEIHRLEKAFRLLDAQGKADYAKLAGEVESKNVQARKDMSLDTLMDIPAWQTQGVPDEDQIVLPPYIPRNRR